MFRKRNVIAQLAIINIVLFAANCVANTFTQSKSVTTATIAQDGFYCLWGRGNYHGWCSKPSPDSGDGSVHAEWSLPFDLTAMPRGSSVTFAGLNTSWTINAPLIYPALWSYPFGTFPGSSRQPIKYMTPGVYAQLTRLAFSDGPLDSFPTPTPPNPHSPDLLGVRVSRPAQTCSH